MFADNYTRGVWICFIVDDSQRNIPIFAQDLTQNS